MRLPSLSAVERALFVCALKSFNLLMYSLLTYANIYGATVKNAISLLGQVQRIIVFMLLFYLNACFLTFYPDEYQILRLEVKGTFITSTFRRIKIRTYLRFYASLLAA